MGCYEVSSRRCPGNLIIFFSICNWLNMPYKSVKKRRKEIHSIHKIITNTESPFLCCFYTLLCEYFWPIRPFVMLLSPVFLFMIVRKVFSCFPSVSNNVILCPSTKQSSKYPFTLWSLRKGRGFQHFSWNSAYLVAQNQGVFSSLTEI